MVTEAMPMKPRLQGAGYGIGVEPDHLIVGSGLAALSFAALAARAGQRVRVVEAHTQAGGYGHTFHFDGKDGRWSFNAQLHYVWNCGPGETVDRFLHHLGLQQEVTFERYDPAGFDHMRMPGLALDVPSDASLLGSRLAGLFPSHADACVAFVDEVVRTDAALRSIPEGLAGTLRVLPRIRTFVPVVRWRNATLGEVFAHFGLPLEARTLLALQWPDFLEPPSRLSFFAFCLLFAGYLRGAWYPTRHFEHVVDTLVAFVRNHGGEVLLGQRVTEYLVEGRRVVGVRVEADGGVTEHRARSVICNQDPRSVAEQIGLDRFSARVRSRLAYEYSPSSFVVYTAVRGIDLRDHGFGRHNVFHTEDPDLDRTFRRMYVDADYRAPSFAITTPSLIGTVPDAPPGHQILQLLTVADHRRFLDLALHDPRGYVRRKNAIADALLEVVEQRYVPGLRDHLAFQMAGSPTTSQRYVQAPAGNSYGSALIPSNMGAGRLDHRTSLEGFRFCNASSGFPGFAGTIFTGCRLWEHLSGERVLG